MKIETLEKLVPGNRVRVIENNTNGFTIGEIVTFDRRIKHLPPHDSSTAHWFSNEKGLSQILTHLQIERL